MGGGFLNPQYGYHSGLAHSRRKWPRIVEEPDEEEQSQSQDQEEDRVELLSEGEALEFIEFDPTVDPKDSWKAPSTITSFLQKHFNRSLSDDEREAIMKDFPRPRCDALTTPKIDDDLKEQLKSRGKDPHFGAEKSLYKIQDQLMDVASPLTCLWADLLNTEAETSPEDVLLLIQRALVLVGSTSHAINMERRWSRLNPKLKSLANEDYEKRKTNLFGPGFLEKASKRLEVDKTLAKVTSQSSASQKTGGYSKNAKAKSLDYGKEDLRSFLDKGASAWHGSRNYRRPQPCKDQGKSTQRKIYFNNRRQSRTTSNTLKGK